VLGCSTSLPLKPIWAAVHTAEVCGSAEFGQKIGNVRHDAEDFYDEKPQTAALCSSGGCLTVAHHPAFFRGTTNR